MTNSEKLLSSFSENYFYKELVYADLKFTPIGGTEIELADLIINLEDIILLITSTATGKDIHVASMDVEAIAVIKKNSKK